MPINAKSAQDFVPIKEVRDGIVVLKDGSLRAVLMASSLNFALKSEEEQQAVLLQFQTFLNSLEFSTQFFIQSKRLDIRPYMSLLEARLKNQTTELMKIQTREYMDFIKAFVEATNIMTKTFFVVVPYTPLPGKEIQRNMLSNILGKKDKKKEAQDILDEIEEHRTQIEQRIGLVEQGLVRSGVRVVQLGTEEIIELFYKIFNPGELEKPIMPE